MKSGKSFGGSLPKPVAEIPSGVESGHTQAIRVERERANIAATNRI